MSSVVRHQPLRVRVGAPSVARTGHTDVQGETPTGLLASRAFWLGGLASVGLWSLVVLALVRAF
ncbi:hypothetical protein [Ramlibacter sp.]|uniref:hypothetical protein n=1 Tax=Ramlibacter sp. TaxID=1917967 RepID=UPI002602B8FD|nr:hypothetical protein [Ramlibacter sp.]